MLDLSPFRSVRAALLLGASAMLGGCDLFDALTDPGSTLVNVFSSHHATPEDGVVPDLGGDGEMRIFENDEGWTVHLVHGAITTRGVTLHRCDGADTSVDFYFGAHTDDLSSTDLSRRTLGGTDVQPGDFCGLTVHYGPFSLASDPPPPTSADPTNFDGATVYLAGFALRGDERVPFEIKVDDRMDVYNDLTPAPSSPLRVTGSEPFPLELTVTKTYDSFFDGVDFRALNTDELGQQARAVLALATSTDISQ